MTFTLKTHDSTGALLECSEYETAEAATAWFDAACSVALENGGTAELTGPKGERVGYFEAPKVEAKK
jgi:hypothetical protein